MRWLLLAFVGVLSCSGLTQPAAAARDWRPPVDGPLLSAFSVGPDPFAAGQHRGIDIAASPGLEVIAACGGRVSFAGRVPRGGRTVSVRCGPLVSTYQHLGGVSVRRGQTVLPGARIGTVGRARPRPHVHLGARVAATGTYLDPLTLFTGAPRIAPPVGPVGRPLPPGRAPVSPVERPPRAPLERGRLAHPPGPAPARQVITAPRLATYRLPWPVWLGLALFGFGLPLGGLVTVRRRRREPARVPRTAS